jgi:hypothetical protein
LTIGVSSAMNVIQSLALSTNDANQKGFYKYFSKIPNEYKEQFNYYNDVFQHIYLHEHLDKLLQNYKEIKQKSEKE